MRYRIKSLPDSDSNLESLGTTVSNEVASGQIHMENLVREYARLTPPAHLRLSSTTFDRVHHVLLNGILLDSHLRAYPPAPEYQLRFWKWAIQKLEVLLGDEVDLQVLNHVALRADPSYRTPK